MSPDLPASIAGVNREFWPRVQEWLEQIGGNALLAECTEARPLDVTAGGRLALREGDGMWDFSSVKSLARKRAVTGGLEKNRRRGTKPTTTWR